MKFKIVFTYLILAVSSTYSQKLPRIQQHGMKAPANVKIDGIDSEWKDSFCAFNNKTNLFYKIANDDSVLYLALKAEDLWAIRKIAFGGIELMISDRKSMNTVNTVRFTYPFYSPSYSPWLINVDEFPTKTSNIKNYSSQVDSVFLVKNKQLSKRIKLIGIGGGGLSLDTAVSIYNSYPITIKSKFNKQLAYFVELSIPRKSLPNVNKFFYRITLSGASANKAKVNIDQSRGRIFVTGKNVPNIVFPLNDEYLDFAFPTYFSGAYSFIK